VRFLTLDIAGTSVEYRIVQSQAKGDQPVLVLLHEGLGCLDMWRDFPEALSAATGASVLVYSRPGYGRSDPVPLPRPLDYMEAHARTVLPAILNVMDFDSFILVGHSDGASIATVYAGEAADPRLRGLSLMAPHFFVEEMGLHAIEQARKTFEAGQLRRALARYHGANVDCAFYGWSGAWLDPGFRTWNLGQFLRRIRVPVQIIQGAGDEYGSPDQISYARDQCPGPVETLLLEDCGHAPFRDQIDHTLSAIGAFLRRLTGDPGPQ
jgi:pimeloyl-ACP methyl ester carboxylesterase